MAIVLGKVLITGANGFLGKHLAQFLEGNNYSVIKLTRETCDLRELEKVETFLAINRPDFVIHLAAKVAPGRSLHDFSDQYSNTTLPAINLAYALPSTVKLAMFVGSIEEYGNNTPPFTENQLPQAFSAYGWAKISSFFAAQFILQQKNISFCWIRPSLLFGNGASELLFFGRTFYGCLRDETIDLTTGDQSRDFLYVKDCCKHFLRIIEQYEKADQQIINISSGRARTIREMALAIQRCIGKGYLNFGALPYRTNENMVFYSSRVKYNNIFGEIPLTNIELALEEIIATEKNNQ